MSVVVDGGRIFHDLPLETTIIASFKHDGWPFRLKFVRDRWSGGRNMSAYSGNSGDMNASNFIEKEYVRMDSNASLHDIVAVYASKSFEIKPTDITFVAITPTDMLV